MKGCVRVSANKVMEERERIKMVISTGVRRKIDFGVYGVLAGKKNIGEWMGRLEWPGTAYAMVEPEPIPCEDKTNFAAFTKEQGLVWAQDIYRKAGF